jgi:tetratricopeptide (TPR) repeat protein
MLKTMTPRLALFLMLAGILLSACSSIGGPTPTEVEIVIDPAQAMTQEASTPVATPTLRPTPTTTATLSPTEIPTPTNTLDPYNTLIAQGRQQRDTNELEPAIATFGQAIQMDPANPLGYIERGITYNAMGLADQAITDFNFAINYDPNSAEAYNARGVSWSQKGQMQQAIKDFTKALELKPDYVAALTNRGIAYLNQQNADSAMSALDDFTKAVELKPDDAEVYFNRGQAYLLASGFTDDSSLIDLCIADMNQSIVLNPQNPEAFNIRASCMVLKTDYEGAYLDFTEAIRLAPEEARYYLYRATLYPDFGDLETALADARKVLELTQDNELRAAAEELLRDLEKAPTPTPRP